MLRLAALGAEEERATAMEEEPVFAVSASLSPGDDLRFDLSY
jgi:hypothetical protein